MCCMPHQPRGFTNKNQWLPGVHLGCIPRVSHQRVTHAQNTQKKGVFIVSCQQMDPKHTYTHATTLKLIIHSNSASSTTTAATADMSHGATAKPMPPALGMVEFRKALKVSRLKALRHLLLENASGHVWSNSSHAFCCDWGVCVDGCQDGGGCHTH